MLYIGRFLIFILAVSIYVDCLALEETVTVPAEEPTGIIVELPSGKYTAQIESGAVALHFPIHTDYRWLYAVSIGTGVDGEQDEPNIGRLYTDPEPAVFTQTEAEEAAIAALKEEKEGTKINFQIENTSKVRFWISDYDYSDNTGSLKVKIMSINVNDQ